MAAYFVSRLPKVLASELEDKVCYICHEEYGSLSSNTNPPDEAVRTPCDHVIGNVCLQAWLDTGSQTCPFCRSPLFNKQSSETPRGNVLVPVQSLLERDGRGSSTEAQDFASARRMQDHIRTILATLRSRNDSEGVRHWMSWLSDWNSLSLARPSEEDLRYASEAMRNLEGMELEYDSPLWLWRVAMARRTRRFREYRLYLQLRASELGIQHSPSAPRPTPLMQLSAAAEARLARELIGDVHLVGHRPLDTSASRETWDQAPRPQMELTSAQEYWLLIRMWERGAFERGWRTPTVGLKEYWTFIREVGFVYDPDKVPGLYEILGEWSLAPY